MSERAYPHVVHRHNVACQSSRNPGSILELIVLHDTQGANIPHSARDLIGLGNFFNARATAASAHVATDEDGNSARYVDDAAKAWSQMYYNSPGLSIEQIGFANQDWSSSKKIAQLHETARWIAYWSGKHKIPIRLGRVSRDGRILLSGVVQHRDLGRLGGGHVDVSATYPMTHVLALARHYKRLQERG